VGFRTPEEAEAAVRYFNKSFMDTMRLAVEVSQLWHAADAWGQCSLPRSAGDLL
jgi:hypothetical protein